MSTKGKRTKNLRADTEETTEEPDKSVACETEEEQEIGEKQTKKGQSPSSPSPSKLSSIKDFFKKTPSREQKLETPKPKKATKTKKGHKKQEKAGSTFDVENVASSKETSSKASSSKDDNDGARRSMVQTNLSNTKEGGIEVISSPEQPQSKVQRKKSQRKSRSTQSLEKQTKGKEKKQTRISNLFPVRKSNRKSKSEQEKEELAKITKAILSKQQEGLEVRNIEGKGRGVFATRPFSKNEFVCEYAGELISPEEAKKREKTYSDDTDIGCYMYYLQCNNKKYCIDATEENGTFGRLLNHSRSGNCKTRLHVIKNKPHLILVATREIKKVEELTYDYGDRSKEALESHPWLKT